MRSAEEWREDFYGQARTDSAERFTAWVQSIQSDALKEAARVCEDREKSWGETIENRLDKASAKRVGHYMRHEIEAHNCAQAIESKAKELEAE